MGFHVPHRPQFTQRLDLARHQIVQRPRRECVFDAAKIRSIREARMRPDRHAVGPRQGHRGAHRRCIARMRPASDVRRGDERHQRRITPRALAEITIEIDGNAHV